MKNKKASHSKMAISRRTFVGNVAAGSAFIALGPVTSFFSKNIQQVEQWPSDATKFRFHIPPSAIRNVWERIVLSLISC